MTQRNIGVIGIGAFGSRVALRLLWSGYHTLQIYDIADVATRMFTNDYGGMALGSPKMMAQTCDVVIAVLPSAAELREVCFGWEGLAQGFSAGGTLIDLGNTDPVETVTIAEELAARGVDLVAAPAFGTPAQAKEGKLTVVVGGTEAAVARCRPVLETIAAKILRADAAGAAQAASAIADYLRAAGLLAARWATEVFLRRIDVAVDIPLNLDYHYDWRVFAYAGAIAAVTGGLMGLRIAHEIARARTGRLVKILRAGREGAGQA